MTSTPRPASPTDGAKDDVPRSSSRFPGATYQHQHKLPHLPIPPLEETIKRYVSALEPLQSADEHEQTQKVAKDFLENDGPILHERLKEYASTRDSYIEEWWTESYLSHADSVVLNLNPFFILEDDPTPSRGSQLIRATSLILASLSFVHDLRTCQLEPDTMRGIPLDMSQYSKLFGTARIPTKTGCKMQVDPDSRHIVVVRRGQFYWFDALDSQDRPAFTEHALLKNLSAIVQDADKVPRNQVAQSALGVLSTERRATWAHYRKLLMDQHEGNRNALDVLDKALFVVCLDDVVTDSATDMCNNMLSGTYKLEKGVQVGTCTNRYYDKLQIIVAANGAAGINFEHSGVDGHTVLRYVADVYTELILLFAKTINSQATTLFKARLSPWAKGAGAKKGKPEVDEEREEIDTEPKKLEWVMTPELKMAVRFAETRLSDLICQNEAIALEFDAYGKNFITRHGFSPDAFVQMAFQASYYSLYGRIECVYEPAMTKAYLHGRTEAIRSVTNESSHFVRTFCSDAPSRDKIDALRAACRRHTALTKECMQGLGQDRLMYAMYCLATQKKADTRTSTLGTDSPPSTTSGADDSPPPLDPPSKIPAIFTDPGYSTLGHSTLSTSNCGNPALRLFGFGGVVSDGFGLGYIIKDEALAFCASSKHLQTSRFLDTLRSYFVEVARMMTEIHRDANRRPNMTFVDHHVGEVDARTGRPLKMGGGKEKKQDPSTSNGYSEYGEEDAFDGGYGFFEVGSSAEPQTKRNRAGSRLQAGTRITTVEI